MTASALLLVVARLLPFAVCAAILFRAFRAFSGSVAYGALLTFVALESLVVLQTEASSLFTAYRPVPVVSLWVAAALLALFVAKAAPRSEPARLSGNRWELVVMVAAGGLLAGTLLTALLGTPNTWDALTYHLPRAMHWIQNASVAHYPTSIERQLKMPPLAEMLFSQTILLTGGDRLVNLVQWSAYGTAALAIYAVIRDSLASRLAGLNGALMFLALPIAVLQASGPKNDLVLCANLMAAVAFFRRGCRGPHWPWIIAGSVALGLSVLTKGTALIFGGWIAACLFATVRRHQSTRRAVATICLLAFGLVAINAGHWTRNLSVFGSLLGPANEGSGYEYAVQRLSPSALLSNLLRNLALNLETPSAGLNRSIESAVTLVHRRLGLREDDPATTWPGARLELRRFPSKNENTSGNPLHLLGILLAVLLAPLVHRSAEHRRFAILVAGALLLAALSFSFLLKWQIWHTRLHLPLFAAGCILVPLVAWRRQRSLAVALVLVAVTSASTMLENDARPLIGKESVFVQSRATNLLRGHDKGARELGKRLSELHVGRLGLLLGSNDPEYLIWYVARSGDHGIQLHHIDGGARTAASRISPASIEAAVTYGHSAEGSILASQVGFFRIDKSCRPFSIWRPVTSP